ncbi:MAG: hypothetical protein R3B70_38865, partial [Polyangiaceae bacterium]
IYDMETAERKCATTLAFESATELKFRKSRFSSAKKKARQAVLDDFRESFVEAASEAMKVAAPDLSLGTTVFD